jgi:arginine decarboxylase
MLLQDCQTKKIKLPVFKELLDYPSKGFTSFHTPAHKSGKLFDKINNENKFSNLSFIGADLSVSCEELDSLHHPRGIIKKSLNLAAQTFGADSTYYGIGGSTLSNLIVMFAVFKPGDRIIVPRNIHKSIWAGISLLKLDPIFIPLTCRGGIFLNVTVDSISNALSVNQDVKGVIVTSPSYDGISADIKSIANTCHSYSVPLIVDEAWGAHFHFSNKFPQSAMSAGADVAIQSPHKVLGSLSQTSLIHLKSKLIDKKKLDETYSYFTTTSPFYSFLASLDYVRGAMDLFGSNLVENLFQISVELRKRLDLKNFKVIEDDIIKKTEFGFDYGKLTLISKKLSGKAVSTRLKNEYKIRVEKYEDKKLLFLLTIADGLDEANVLYNSLNGIDKFIETKNCLVGKKNNFSANSKFVQKPSFSVPVGCECVPIIDCINRISNETIIPYPPGIPVLYSGEKINKNKICELNRIKNDNLMVLGAADSKLNTLIVKS